MTPIITPLPSNVPLIPQSSVDVRPHTDKVTLTGPPFPTVAHPHKHNDPSHIHPINFPRTNLRYSRDVQRREKKPFFTAPGDPEVAETRRVVLRP